MNIRMEGILLSKKGMGCVLSRGQKYYVPGYQLSGFRTGDKVRLLSTHPTCKQYPQATIATCSRWRFYVAVVRGEFWDPQGIRGVYLYSDSFGKKTPLYARHCTYPYGTCVSILQGGFPPSLECQILQNLGSIFCRREDAKMLCFKYQVVSPSRRTQFSLPSFPLSARDLTSLDTLTLDPPKAHELDDALSIDAHRVYVSIATFLLPRSLEDTAFQKQFSLYLPEKVSPLFPKALSRHKWSLLPGKTRYTLTLEWDHELQFQGISFARIQNKKQWTYEEAETWLQQLESYETFWGTESTSASGLYRLRALYRKFRHKDPPALENSLPKYKVRLREGKISALQPCVRTEMHSMVEFYMILANRTMATWLASEGWLFPCRVHDPPELYGLNPAYYSLEKKPHDGLKCPLYTHFTSPLRRYVDCMIHKLVLYRLAGRIPEGWTRERLQNICDMANAQERKLEELTREYFRLKYYDYWLEHSTPIEAVVLSTSLSPRRIQILLPPPLSETVSLPLSPAEAYRTFRVGEKIRLRLASVSSIYREPQWKIEEAETKI